MKKHLLFAILFSAFAFNLSAQLASGSKLTGNVTGIDVVTDEAVDLQAWLADGKSVVVDVFATWCGPCWGFHATGWLDDMNERFGPDGTDQIRIVGVEADGSTSVASILTNQFGEPGSWVVNPETLEPITYNIIDSPAAINTLGIAFFPTLYIIRPDGTLVEIGNNRYNEEYWIAAMGIEPGPKAFVGADLPNNSFCEETVMPETTVEFENLGDAPLTSATINVYGNGVMLESVEYSGSAVGIFRTGSVQISGQSFSETTEITVGLAEVNGSTDVESSLSSTVVQPRLTTDNYTFQFTTDFYPGEATWEIQDDNGNVLASDSYSPGNADNFGGGGADANTTHEYELMVASDVVCLNVILEDSYGDGYIYWNTSTHTEPGFAILDSDGNVVKESAEGRFQFTVFEGSVNAASTSSLPNLDQLEISKVYPNPVNDNLNIELGFNETINFSIDVINAYGQVVKDLGNFNSNNFNRVVDVTDLNPGMYLISIRSEQGQKTLKFNKM